jgi:hypothetical protein
MRKLLGFLAAAGAVGAGLYATLRKGGGHLSGARRRGGLRGEHEARELLLTCENDGDLYRQQVQPIEKNLKRKMEKGIYDHEKSKKLWMYLADNCARKYAKEYGDGRPWHKMFSTADRREVAKAFADSFRDEHLHQAKHGITPGGRSR